MKWFSIYGTGAMLHGIERSADDEERIEFTSWLTVCWVPVFPLASYSAIYAGELMPDGITDEGYAFTDIQRIPHEGARLLQTFARGIVVMIVALAPAAYMIYRTNGRAASNLEFVFVLLAACWPVYLIVRAENIRKDSLRGG